MTLRDRWMSMTPPTPSGSDRSAATTPTTCPVCASSSVSTTAKRPGVDSYWRCASCGEVWNAGRRTASRFTAR
jgi:transposase-like protein